MKCTSLCVFLGTGKVTHCDFNLIISDSLIGQCFVFVPVAVLTKSHGVGHGHSAR